MSIFSIISLFLDRESFNQNTAYTKQCLAFHGWEVSSSPTGKELLSPTHQCEACGSISWCSPLKIYTAVSTEAARYAPGQAEGATDGGKVGGREGWRGRRVWPWKSPPGGVVEGQQGAPQHTKPALCEISSGHQEGPTALFSQSVPVCFLWASEAAPVRRAACWQHWKLCWVAAC